MGTSELNMYIFIYIYAYTNIENDVSNGNAPINWEFDGTVIYKWWAHQSTGISPWDMGFEPSKTSKSSEFLLVLNSKGCGESKISYCGLLYI